MESILFSTHRKPRSALDEDSDANRGGKLESTYAIIALIVLRKVPMDAHPRRALNVKIMEG